MWTLAVPLLRLARIVAKLLRLALAAILHRLHIDRSKTSGADRLASALARLGTTFIKFGQALSLQRDLLPDDYVTALQSLQDRVASFPAEDAKIRDRARLRTRRRPHLCSI